MLRGMESGTAFCPHVAALRASGRTRTHVLRAHHPHMRLWLASERY